MKILHIITNTELGGAQKVCIDLCTKAVEFAHEVAVTSMAGGYLWEQLPAQVKQYKLKNMVKPIRPISDLKVLKELKTVKKDFNPVSDYDKQNLINEKITRNVQTIYNGIGESADFENITLPDCCKNKRIIMTIARIAAPKRLDLFLDVAKAFDSKEYEFGCIGGDSNHSVEELQQLYNDLATAQQTKKMFI